MRTKISIHERLKDLRVEHHLTLDQLAEKTRISRSALGSYESKEGKDISHKVLEKLADVYHVSTDYLLGRTETKHHSNSALHELNLSDEMITLLKSGKVNNNLLCELVLHKGFTKFMADLELYIDRIVSDQFAELHTMQEIARMELQDQYNSADYGFPTLQDEEEAGISEDHYFLFKAHEDMDTILRDIREKHKTQSFISDLKARSERIINSLLDWNAFMTGSKGKLVKEFCKEHGLAYDKLTSKEVLHLSNTITKSQPLLNQRSKRGRLPAASK